MAALMFAAVLFNINVSALTSQEYEQEILGLLYDLENGYITPEQYEQYENEVTTRFIESNTDSNGVVDTVAENIANTVKSITEGICEAVQKTGDNFKDWLSDIFDDFETQEEIPTIDLQGNGALIVATKSNGYVYKQYCEYVILEFTDNYPAGEYVPKNTTSAMVYTTDGRSWKSTQSSFPIIDYQSVQVYGDVRYENGETAPSTEIPTTSDTVFNIDELSDNELDELLKDILEELERQNPDLSTIEGLLSAIYYQVCGINSKMITYDQCNALIMSLISSNNENAQDIINALFEIREDLKNEDSGTSEDENTDEDSGETGDSSETSDGHPDHICGTVYNVKPLDMNWLVKLTSDPAEVKVEYQGNSYYLESCGCLKLTKDTFLGFGGEDGYYTVDMNYDDYMSIDYDFSNENITIDNSKYVDVDFKNYNTMWLSLSTSQRNKINNIVELIYKMVEQAVPYSMVTTTLQAFQVVIFNTATPEDVVLSFDEANVNGVTIGGFEVTVLSTEFFSNDKVKSAMKIVKAFLTVVIGYSWLLSMRKKVVGMLG